MDCLMCEGEHFVCPLCFKIDELCECPAPLPDLRWCPDCEGELPPGVVGYSVKR
jgi:hypothetical protein